MKNIYLTDIMKTLLKESGGKKSYGCIMVATPFKNWDTIWAKMINPDDLYFDENEDGYGIATDPHATILYGLRHDKNIISNLKQYLIPNLKLSIQTNSISSFVNKSYDVLKFDIDSEQLEQMNKDIYDNMSYTTDFPIFHAHMTIAYLKSGTAYKYERKLPKILKISAPYYIYSTPNNEQTKFKI